MRYFSFLAIAVSLPALAQVGNLQLNTSVLNFSAISGSSLPQSQIFGVSSTGAEPITPSNITVNFPGLAPGVYNGTVSIAGGAIGGFSVSPRSLNFLYQTGTSNPAAQSNASWLRLISVNNSIPAQTVTGASNSNLTVYVDSSGLSPGFYSANITVGGTSLLAVSPREPAC